MAALSIEPGGVAVVRETAEVVAVTSVAHDIATVRHENGKPSAYFLADLLPTPEHIREPMARLARYLDTLRADTPIPERAR